jgi:hypothetical protein
VVLVGELVARFVAEVADGDLSGLGLVCGPNERHVAFDGDVLVGRFLVLDGEGESSGRADQLVLQRPLAGPDGQLAAGLVGVLDRHGQWRTIGPFHCEYADVEVGQEAFAVFVAHVRHDRANRSDAVHIPWVG